MIDQNALNKVLQHYVEVFPSEAPDIEKIASSIASNTDLGFMLQDNPRFHVTASCLLVARDGDRIAVIERSQGVWLQPGGHVEPRETLQQAAQRELTEETGIASVILHPWHRVSSSPIDIDCHRLHCRGQEAKHLDFRFIFLQRAESPVDLPKGKWISTSEVRCQHAFLTIRRAVTKLVDLGLNKPSETT